MADEARTKRAAALEEKKRRLEALKARRTNRSNEPDSAAAAPASAPGNLDDYIDGLLSSKAPEVPKAEEEKPEAAPELEPAAPAAAAEPVQVAAEPAPPAPVAPPARKVETFAFGTQTEEGDFPFTPEEEEKKKRDEDEAKKKAAEEVEEKKDDSGRDAAGMAGLSPARALSPDEVELTVRTAPFSKFLNSASKKVERLLGAPVLADLLVDADYAGETEAEAAVVAERDRKAREAKERGGARGADLVKARVAFECARWTAGRDCTDLDWSPVHRELMLASYHAPYSSAEDGSEGGGGKSVGGGAAVRGISPDDTPSASLIPRSGELQSDGLALVWSLAMPTRPEHIFTCGSPVLVGRFHPTEHHLVVGGCQSGQVVVWDIRAGRLPVQRSTMAAGSGSGLGGHAHPICSMEVVEGGSGLVTAATDGQVNFWSLASLRDPAESLTVGGPISCLAVAPESGTLVCGDESGGLHAVQTSADASSAGTSSSSRRTIRRIDAGSLDTGGRGESDGGRGHFGVITSVATKPPPRTGGHISRGFLRGPTGLVLTAGIDWTTRLWAPAYKDEPLLSFLSHSYDYMCDVQWSPVHPSVFATASSSGTLGLWNLASSLDEPLSGADGIVVDGTDAAAGGGTPRGLNKIRWSQDGRRIAVASSDQLHVLSVSDDVSRPKTDDEVKMMSNLKSRDLLVEL